MHAGLGAVVVAVGSAHAEHPSQIPSHAHFFVHSLGFFWHQYLHDGWVVVATVGFGVDVVTVVVVVGEAVLMVVVVVAVVVVVVGAPVEESASHAAHPAHAKVHVHLVAHGTVFNAHQL